MQQTAIHQVRRFNRTVTEGIGVLDSHFMGRERPVGEARLLWEIGTNGVEVRTLRTRLGLDSGYVSRVLRSLERQKLVRVRTSTGDGRVRHAYLTRSGLAERKELDRLSDALAGRILDPLNEKQRARLLTAMTDVERLIEASMVCFAVEDPESADANWCLQQYFDELNARFEGGFDATVSRPTTADEIRPPAGAFVIARLRGRPVACGLVKCQTRRPAHIRRMWVAPSVRGLGVGRRLLQELEQRAQECGARSVHLDTNRALREAISLYQRAGYKEVKPFSDEPYAHHWFAKRLR
jgi:DNA-binding MarR family transcriptional regulator/N-acetylglutamate synthase-like GNAT family acetyltransferase